MKKFFFFLSTIALLGLASACVEQIQVNNPNYDAEKGTVKTQFVINVANTAQTKATADDVQAEAANKFRGMEGIRLFMSKGYQTSDGYVPYETNYIYDLKDYTPIYGASNLNVAQSITADDSRRVYEMIMPTGVDNMVFYAKAPTTTGSAIKYPFKTDASATTTDPTTKTATTFELVPITTETTVFTTNASATALLGILNAVAGVTSWYTTDDVTLATALNNFVNTEAIATSATTTTVETLRQGSADAVKRTMEDLYKIVEKRTDAVSTAIKAAILGENNANFTATASTETTPAKLTYANTNIQANFPADLGLPVGAAQVKCTVSKTDGVITRAVFSWVSPSSTLGTAESLNYANLRFPPVLCYWADSPIRVSNTEGVEEETDFYPNGVTNWNSETAWTNAKGNWLAWANNKAITKDTRAVALKNNVLYGTALAKYTVQLKAATLNDNRKALVPHLSDQEITVASKFKVKGILIGGQPKAVAWNFIPTDSDRSAVIYDNVPNHTNAITTSASNPFYTMVFDNYNSGGGAQDDVVFALELENNAGDFYGKDNIIYDGGTFYLCGKMKKSDLAATYADLTSLKDLGYRIPPVATDGTMATPVPRIFMQDFVTTVTITLGDDALKNAYATIPDLRPINMYFGLSVDLTWKAGASLSVEL
jgi:hypothetical protein